MVVCLSLGSLVYTKRMIRAYLEEALRRAHYELIDDEEPFYAEIPELPGVWATGPTLEACRERLEEVVEGWLLVRLTRGLPVPTLNGLSIEIPRDMPVG